MVRIKSILFSTCLEVFSCFADRIRVKETGDPAGYSAKAGWERNV